MAHEVDTNKLKHLSYPENTRSAVLYKELTLAVYHHVSLCIFYILRYEPRVFSNDYG